MSEIRVKENESLESALRRFKRSCAKEGVIAEVNIAVQVNGKMRGTVLMDADLSNEEVVANAVADEKIAKFLQKQGGQIVKTIVVKNKLVNLIVK